MSHLSLCPGKQLWLIFCPFLCVVMFLMFFYFLRTLQLLQNICYRYVWYYSVILPANEIFLNLHHLLFFWQPFLGILELIQGIPLLWKMLPTKHICTHFHKTMCYEFLYSFFYVTRIVTVLRKFLLHVSFCWRIMQNFWVYYGNINKFLEIFTTFC